MRRPRSPLTATWSVSQTIKAKLETLLKAERKLRRLSLVIGAETSSTNPLTANGGTARGRLRPLRRASAEVDLQMVAKLITIVRQTETPAAAETGNEAQARLVKAVGAKDGSPVKAGAGVLHGRKDRVPGQGTIAPGKKTSGSRLD